MVISFSSELSASPPKVWMLLSPPGGALKPLVSGFAFSARPGPEGPPEPEPSSEPEPDSAPLSFFGLFEPEPPSWSAVSVVEPCSVVVAELEPPSPPEEVVSEPPPPQPKTAKARMPRRASAVQKPAQSGASQVYLDGSNLQ